ncbi:hypothetical protein JRO89_XS13G0239100 [Xanthoceras sorbifolium]|uniref:Ribosomal protein L19e C-terminal domain-containing protein n=1 Tax=Xanthoceras sorbifolium TaxID=99658 RepID=A0ABQ8H9R5_9ROSI|nr:hypothetical protein JRO89_XS13G0239100 [Xanthoceras sorbifolium]
MICITGPKQTRNLKQFFCEESKQPTYLIVDTDLPPFLLPPLPNNDNAYHRSSNENRTNCLCFFCMCTKGSCPSLPPCFTLALVHDAGKKLRERDATLDMRKGTREARLPTKILWMRRMRVLRRLLRNQKAEKAREKTLSYHFLAKRAKNKASRERKLAKREEMLAQGPVDNPSTAPPAAAQSTE